MALRHWLKAGGLAALLVTAISAFAQDNSDLTFVIALAMARDVDQRCGILADNERATLQQFIERGIQEAHLDDSQTQTILTPNSDSDAIECNSLFLQPIFDLVRSQTAN